MIITRTAKLGPRPEVEADALLLVSSDARWRRKQDHNQAAETTARRITRADQVLERDGAVVLVRRSCRGTVACGCRLVEVEQKHRGSCEVRKVRVQGAGSRCGLGWQVGHRR